MRASGPTGTTLTEVLITLLIMAIGVVTCATLFPISVMRSLRATQLTHATILRHNIEAAVDVDPEIILDPDGDWDRFNPATDNPGLHEHVANPNTSFLGTNQPIYVIDPLGAVVTGSATLGSVPRYSLGATTQAAAHRTVSLPTWSTIGEDTPSTVNLVDGQGNPLPTQSAVFQMPSTLDFDTASQSALSVEVRGVFFDSSGRVSEVRNLAAADIRRARMQWSPPLRDPRFYASSVSNIRIETRNHDYTWMLTVRNGSDTLNPARENWRLDAEVDVAIFFRRGFDPNDEQVFTPASPGNQYTISGSGNEYTITWPQGGRPAIKKGGFVLDVEHGRWFRIEAIADSATSARFVIDSSPPQAMQEACFMRGLVEVFRIGKKSAPSPPPAP